MNLAKTTDRAYDYILAGGGMAGLSLAYYIAKSSLGSRRILIIDRGIRKEQTFCYWSDTASEFEFLAEKSWDSLYFHSARPSSLRFSIAPYAYYKINSKTWFSHVEAELSQHSNIHFLAAEIQSIAYQGEGSLVETSEGLFYASVKIFDSFSPFPVSYTHLRAHETN
jgi:lycopene beta-cyclase